ncbi:MAG: hypothetical protein A3F77_11300 [Betaproteobacteria bacterium RIFCSPLOWO2_12_FULL_67_28]|nr:MAG: hypothetical protein A3I65_05490 [Betaproteobacteria bacterium RIFCSPLOWO2_02_FULL_68_150]OGA68242.1 MAG: hypothetical protein A3F77_11300 [Betaproteobacteria bacterium RIFCSPLOWO2_12_FULL_67_28]
MLAEVAFVAAFTARSQAYAQAMTRAGIAPGLAVLYGEEHARLLGQASDPLPPMRTACGIDLPDLSEPLAATVRGARWNATRLRDADVNSDALATLLDRDRFRLIVFSGYGGQIVKRKTLEQGIPFLHVHAGWLPRFRGSTTIYYEMLLERRCSASAILLSPQLDAGPIVARKHYPLPPADVDIDYVYEPATRADLLLEVLREFAENRVVPSGVAQSPQDGVTHFVIHPVLKHLAILSLPQPIG